MPPTRSTGLVRAILIAGFAILILLGGIGLGFLAIRRPPQHPPQGLLGTARSLQGTPFCQKYRCVLSHTYTDTNTGEAT